MNFFEALILGVVQGLTEFLPVSSSGHLVLAEKLLGFEEPMLFFDVAVHGGTLLAICLFFKKDVLSLVQSAFKVPGLLREQDVFTKYPDVKLLFHIGVSFIPTMIIALVFKFGFKEIFGNLSVVSMAWLIMGVYLLMGKWFYSNSLKNIPMNWQIALLIGVAQGLAVTPGISRSGFTILTALFLGIGHKESVRFSFLMSIPVILAAIMMEMLGVGSQTDFLMPVLVGFVVSFVVGYLIIGVLIRLVEKGGFFNFGFYCLCLSLISFLLLF